MKPKELLATVNRIEAEANRTREIHWDQELGYRYCFTIIMI